MAQTCWEQTNIMINVWYIITLLLSRDEGWILISGVSADYFQNSIIWINICILNCETKQKSDNTIFMFFEISLNIFGDNNTHIYRGCKVNFLLPFRVIAMNINCKFVEIYVQNHV